MPAGHDADDETRLLKVNVKRCPLFRVTSWVPSVRVRRNDWGPQYMPMRTFVLYVHVTCVSLVPIYAFHLPAIYVPVIFRNQVEYIYDLSKRL